MKKTETLELFKSNFDKKNKLNRLDKKVNQTVLDEIETGLTIEKLEDITKDLPVFKYLTQITIHGLFPELQNHRISGYKNLFQNKNQSIGVRWSAIDENKRRELNQTLKFTKFFYKRNSNEHVFRWQKIIMDEKSFKETLSEMKKMLSEIDTSLFYGSKRIYAASGMFGLKFLVLDFSVDAIYQKNVPVLLEKMGFSESWKQSKIKEKQVEDEKIEREFDAKQKEKQKKKDAAHLAVKDDIDYLKSNFKSVQTTENGIYIKPIYRSLEEDIVFKLSKVEKTGRQKFPRVTEKIFKTVPEALKYKFDGTETKRKIRIISGYEIPQKKEIQPETKHAKIFIIDYSDKAIAIFGDTKPIKDKLKSIGCRFNPRLKNNGDKQPGWIASKDKRQKVESLI